MAEQTLEQAQAEIRTLQGRVDTLEGENYGYRSKIREKDNEIGELKGRVPAEGDVVLKKEDAAKQTQELEAYRALGSVKDVTKSLQDGKDAQESVRKGERQTLISEAAGKDLNAKALAKFLPDDAVLEKQGQGDKAKWVVKQGDATQPLGEFVKGIEEETGVSLRSKPVKEDVGGGPRNPGDPNPKEPSSFLEAISSDN